MVVQLSVFPWHSLIDNQQLLFQLYSYHTNRWINLWLENARREIFLLYRTRIPKLAFYELCILPLHHRFLAGHHVGVIQRVWFVQVRLREPRSLIPLRWKIVRYWYSCKRFHIGKQFFYLRTFEHRLLLQVRYRDFHLIKIRRSRYQGLSLGRLCAQLALCFLLGHQFVHRSK